MKRLRCLLSVMLFACIILCEFAAVPSKTGIAFNDLSVVHAAKKTKKSKKTKNLSKSIKVKTNSGRAMKSDEADALCSSSFKMLDAVIKADQKGVNVFISPVSIYYAFGMAENGARGTSKSQLEDVINGGIKTDDFNKVLASTRKRMMSSKEVKWNIANSIWIRNRKDIRVKKPFLKKAKAYYGAEIYKAPFDAGTVKEINSWVNKNTHKMIKKIITNINSDEVMYLINAVAFEGEWAEQFRDRQIVKDQTFTNLDGTTSKTVMLNGKEDYYYMINGAKAFRKKYKDYNYSFVGIEMPDNVTPAAYIEELAKDGSAFTKGLGNAKMADVYIKLPEFNSDYDIEMTKVLKALGAVDVFNPDKADLYNMFYKDKDNNYYFDKVLHKTHVEVDRNGTKAAAVTAISIVKATSVRIEKERVQINLDHPFVYAIVDDKTNIPVFVGCYNTK